ncbi:MAG: hypothetical protein O9972_14675 [Burkholderiales bacterium]|jgi:hypothetical protein|nr:hypothetical protein [Burkholderiales bacterium]
MKPLAGMAAAVSLLLCASVAHAFDRAPSVGGAPFGGVNRPVANPGFPGMNRPGHIARPGALHAARHGALNSFAGAWPLWYGSTQPSSTRVIVNVNVNTSGPTRLPTAADLPVKPGYVTTPPDPPAFIVVTAPQAQAIQPVPRPSAGVVGTAGTARVIEVGDGFLLESAVNPRIISLR